MFLEACSGCPHHLLQRVPVSLLVHTLENLQHSGLSTHQVQTVLQCCEHVPSAARFWPSSLTSCSTAKRSTVMSAGAVLIREVSGERDKIQSTLKMPDLKLPKSKRAGWL